MCSGPKGIKCELSGFGGRSFRFSLSFSFFLIFFSNFLSMLASGGNFVDLNGLGGLAGGAGGGVGLNSGGRLGGRDSGNFPSRAGEIKPPVVIMTLVISRVGRPSSSNDIFGFFEALGS